MTDVTGDRKKKSQKISIVIYLIKKIHIFSYLDFLSDEGNTLYNDPNILK